MSLASGVARLETLGYECVVAPHAQEAFEYFSAPDDVRLADFQTMLADPSIDMMMMSRGGYGLSRIVHRIDWQAVASSKKILCGFSDFTAINLAALSLGNFVTLAGPGVATDFAAVATTSEGEKHNDADHQFMQAHFLPVVHGEDVEITVDCTHPYAPQTITGPIWGSNLSLICDLGGSRFIPDVAGGILFIEEIGEKPYVIERMLLQLYHAGVLARQRAIIIGVCNGFTLDADRFPYALNHVINTLRTLLPIPILTELPFGHVAKKSPCPTALM
ncbi:MAG: LD-carboxypeptidase [Gammaproteobacteria bacterium]|nr:LD-carboxypeptidase [Gammaproteobacteria bacterium]